MKRSVISGTPRMNSMNPTQSDLTRSMSERRPSARTTPMGSEKAMPVMPMVKARTKPPNWSESTTGNQKGATWGNRRVSMSTGAGMLTSVVTFNEIERPFAAKYHHSTGATTAAATATILPAIGARMRKANQPTTMPARAATGRNTDPPQRSQNATPA